MHDHECVACGVEGDREARPWWSVREDDVDEYEAICDACIKQYGRCYCCGDSHPEDDLTTVRFRALGEVAICSDCMTCSTDMRCEILANRAEHEDAVRWQRERRLAEEAELSEVRESVKVSLERMAQRNQTSV